MTHPNYDGKGCLNCGHDDGSKFTEHCRETGCADEIGYPPDVEAWPGWEPRADAAQPDAMAVEWEAALTGHQCAPSPPPVDGKARTYGGRTLAEHIETWKGRGMGDVIEALAAHIADLVAELGSATVEGFERENRIAEMTARAEAAEAERDRLRTALVACAHAAGANISPECSTDFLCNVPMEVHLVVRRLTAERDRMTEAVDVAREAIPIMRALGWHLAAACDHPSTESMIEALAAQETYDALADTLAKLDAKGGDHAMEGER